MKAWMVAWCAALVCGAAAAGGLRPEKMGDWTIVVAEDASPAERYAAEEFQTLFRGLTGLDLPVAARPRGGSKTVSIGPGAAARAERLSFDAAGMGEESLRVRIGRNSIVIAGGRPRGTLYGVYEFFERYCGVRFLTADDTHFPDRAALPRLQDADFSYTPPFSFRWSYYKENSDRPDFAARMRVNTVVKDERMGGSTRQTLIGHSYCRWITTEKHGQTHPEYFALVDGARTNTRPTPATEPCVTNPEVIDIITQGVLDDLRANPGAENIAVSQNDNDAYCRCPRCEEINQREGTPMGANLALVNTVAERVEREHPGVKIGTLAYWYTRQAPKTIAPRKNVQIQLCSIECCELHPIDDPDCPKNRAFCDDMRAWKAVCDNVWVWNYNTNFSFYDLPFPNLFVIGPNLRFFRDNHARGVFMQANGNGNAGEFCDLRNYVLSRSLWDPSLDSGELVREFCELHYREAAPAVLEYIRFIHGNAEEKGCHPNCGAAPNELGITPDVARKAYDLFAEALAAAKDDTVRARVEKASIPAHRALILVNGFPWKVENGVCKRDLPAEYAGLVPRYVALCKKHNMSMVSEQMPAADYFTRLERMEAMPAVRLENGTWRLTVLPGQNAKLVELLHKPTGRCVLPALTRDNVLQGALDETGVLGFLSTADSAFQAEAGDSTVRLTRALDDGSTVVRTVTLDGDAVRFESRVTNGGPAPKRFQFRVRPEFDAYTDDPGSGDLGVYIRGAGWERINREWKDNKGPDKEKMLAARGGGFAYFNRAAGAGVRLDYDPACVKNPQFWWRPQYRQANLELYSQEQELKPGESLSMAYRLRFLDGPPAD